MYDFNNQLAASLPSQFEQLIVIFLCGRKQTHFMTSEFMTYRLKMRREQNICNHQQDWQIDIRLIFEFLNDCSV